MKRRKRAHSNSSRGSQTCPELAVVMAKRGGDWPLPTQDESASHAQTRERLSERIGAGCSPERLDGRILAFLILLLQKSMRRRATAK